MAYRLAGGWIVCVALAACSGGGLEPRLVDARISYDSQPIKYDSGYAYYDSALVTYDAQAPAADTGIAADSEPVADMHINGQCQDPYPTANTMAGAYDFGLHHKSNGYDNTQRIAVYGNKPKYFKLTTDGASGINRPKTTISLSGTNPNQKYRIRMVFDCVHSTERNLDCDGSTEIGDTICDRNGTGDISLWGKVACKNAGNDYTVTFSVQAIGNVPCREIDMRVKMEK